VPLDLPDNHRVPVTWIRENACAPIRWRTVRDVLPPGSATRSDLVSLQEELLEYRPVKQIAKKQWANGSWSGNILGIAPSKSQGIKDVGTVAQYRRLLEMGVPTDARPFKLADRLFFRILSRDEDAALLFEFKKAASSNPEAGTWYRDLMKQGATAALAQAGYGEDPRLRGAAHRILSNVSHFLRSEAAEKPIVRKGSRSVLDAEAYPPTIFTVATLAFMPRLQRERAGLVERLTTFLNNPAPKKTFVIQIGRKVIKPTFHLLGDPIATDSSGRPKDLPLALHWLEVVVRMGTFDSSPTAQRVFARLLKDCDDRGVWDPGNLRTLPKSQSGIADFACPLEDDARLLEARKADVSFRLSLIAKLLGLRLEYC